MLNYEGYSRSSEGGKSLMMRRLFEQHNWMMETCESLAQEVAELKREKADRESGKGVPDKMKEMGYRSIKPKIIS